MEAKVMTLDEYIESEKAKGNRHVMRDLHFATELAYLTLNRAREGKCSFVHIGERIHKATGGLVPIDDAYRNSEVRRG